MSLAPYLRPRGGAVELAVRVTPRARRAGIDGPVPDAAGDCWLRVRVTEPPEAGKATAAVEALIAERCDLPRGAVRLLSGPGSRWKRLLIQADADRVGRCLMAGHDGEA